MAFSPIRHVRGVDACGGVAFQFDPLHFQSHGAASINHGRHADGSELTTGAQISCDCCGKPVGFHHLEISHSK